MPQQIISVFMMLLTVTLAISPTPPRGQVTLSASTLEPIEGSQVMLICNNSGTNCLGVSLWKKNNTSIGSMSYGNTTFCKVRGKLLNEDYITHCVSLVLTTVTTNVTFDLDNIPWTCSQGNVTSNTVILTVQVPVKHVSIVPNGPILTLRENVNKSFTCTTSFCRPQANVTWYISDGTGSHIFLNGSKSSSNHNVTTTLVSTVSVLEVDFNRRNNGWMLVCEAANTHKYTTVSRNISLNITYPTTEPKILCTNNGKYKVIQNSTGYLTCAVDGGNPVGALHWNCTGDTALHTGSENTVSQSLVWNATQIQYCTCNSTNIAGSSSTTVMTDILYPPVINKMENTTVFEGDNVTVVCAIARANPPAHTIQWSSDIGIVANATLSIPNVSRSDDMSYSCTARNSMEPSCQEGEQGNTTIPFHLLVLYPPYVNISSNTTITFNEWDMVNYTCPIVHGNPRSTNITWRRSRDTKTWNSAELIINATRYDESVYTCYAENVMVNSSNITRIGNASGEIRLIVQFQANVTDFYIKGYIHNTSVTVCENTNLTFECLLQSKPTADVRLYRMDTLVTSSNSNQLLYNATTVCHGRPLYYNCNGTNSLNNQPSTRQIQLCVKCVPRADMNVDVHFNVTSDINQTVTLSYTTLAYPHPSFVWYRKGDSINISDQRMNVFSSNLQTNLTIDDVEERDFGEYTLNVTNDVGSINELFHLKPNGVPEVPTQLTQDNTSTTTSIIALNWKSGFKNGPAQSFTLMYSKQTEEKWQSADVQDAGHSGTTIHYNITELSSDTRYDIVLFAVNAKGRSKSNATLTGRTNEESEQQHGKGSGNSATIGAAGGSAAGLTFIGLVIVGVIILKRRMRNKPPDEPEASATLYVNVKNDNKSVVKHELNSLEVQTDQGIYENSELGKTENQSQKSSAAESSQFGEYVTFSKKKLAEMPKTRQEGLPMRTISPGTKATTQRSTASNLPPPIPSKTEFAGVLCKEDDHEDHEGNNAHQTDDNIYGNSSEKIEQIENVFVHELFAFTAGKPFESFAAEHLTLPKGLTMPCTVAVKPENFMLNRYNGIFPYDHSRVTIPEDPDFYINACYIDGYKKEKCYIASLGPTADTSSGFKTFWKMVWYEQSDIIIMVTNLRELTGMKCEQYWPKNGTSRVYGEVTVMCRNVEEYAEYTIRTFSVSKTTHNRTVTQLHFTAWPDKGVPDDLTSLLEFRQRLKSISNPESGPIVVHCSAGIGRTGTLIALDRLIAEGKATQSIHVSRCVRSMRQQRVNMVQTPEQYLYLYKACVYALVFECECISAETFHDKIKATTDAQFGELFTNLKPMVDNESDDEKKAILNHKLDKSNRPTADIAGDKYRIRLYVDKKSSDSDYTNAVYINSFEIKNIFIAAQTPLKDFVQDFICMIFQERCVCVLDMDGNTPSQLDVGVYVPAISQSFTFGNFTISCDKHYSNQKYTVNKMKIENKGKFYKGERTTYHFKYHDWKHGKETPTDPSDFVEFVKEVDDYATQFGERESHVLVHCLDASKRSGLFCFVACLLKKIQCEKEVNVGNTLRQVRTRRKTTIKNANQLKFCYKTVDTFIEMNKAK